MVIEGIAELPLHDGHVPEYLLKRMKKLGSLIARYIVETYGAEELIKRLADPFWFQAFNNVIGMDWDSSGSTTVVLYVLKSVFPPERAKDCGVAVLGGKGANARGLPNEARLLSGILNPEALVETSRLSARVDSVALQDGYTLYIHGVVVSAVGRTLVIQQGMNVNAKLARRYHILVEKPGIYSVERDPHSGVASIQVAPALNLVDESSAGTRRAILEILKSTPVSSLVQDLYRVNRALKRLPSLEEFTRELKPQPDVTISEEKFEKCPHFYKPVTDVKHVEAVAEEIKRRAPLEFSELLLVPGLGPESMRAIALVADLIYGYEPSFRDPTTHPLDPFLYTYAHGGKDGVPYRVRPRDLDKTIEFFSSVVDSVKADGRDKDVLLRYLSRFVRRIVATYERNSYKS